MKKICFVANNISTCGGLEKMCILLCNLLSKANEYEVCIASIYATNNSFFKINENVKTYTLFRLASKFKIFKIYSNIRQNRINRLYKFLKKQQIDIVVDLDTPLCLITSLPAKKLNIKHISWDHFNHNAYEFSKDRLKAFETNKQYNNNIIVITKADQEYYIKKGYPENLVKVIPNTCDVDNNKEIMHKDTKTIISIGRYSWEKGFDLLLDAWKIVEAYDTGWTLKIYGPKYNAWDEIQKKASFLKLQNLELNTETKNTQEVYKNAQIYVCSSRLECFPVVLLEACAYSLPIVSFDCPDGPREIVKDNINGYLVEAGNIYQLAEKILMLINDKESLEKFSINSFKVSKDFSKTKFIENWTSYLSSI